MSIEHELIDQIETTSLLPDIMFQIRQFAESRRQFSVIFHTDGSALISSPMIGARNAATPQPTPPIAQAISA